MAISDESGSAPTTPTTAGAADACGDIDDLQVVRATYRVAELVRNMRASSQTRVHVHALLGQIASLLEPDSWPGPYAVEQLMPPGSGRLVYDPDNLALTVPYSPMLGPRNPISPEVQIRADGEIVTGRIRFSALHAGPMNAVHGSAVSALFDELLALAMIATGYMGYTRSIDVQFLKPTPLSQWLDFTAQFTGLSGRNLFARAELRMNDELTASATGTFKTAFRRDDDPYATRR